MLYIFIIYLTILCLLSITIIFKNKLSILHCFLRIFQIPYTRVNRILFYTIENYSLIDSNNIQYI